MSLQSLSSVRVRLARIVHEAAAAPPSTTGPKAQLTSVRRIMTRDRQASRGLRRWGPGGWWRCGAGVPTTAGLNRSLTGRP